MKTASPLNTQDEGYGFSVRGDAPVVVAGVEQNSLADVRSRHQLYFDHPDFYKKDFFLLILLVAYVCLYALCHVDKGPCVRTKPCYAKLCLP